MCQPGREIRTGGVKMPKSVFGLDTVRGVPMIWGPLDEPKLSQEDSLLTPLMGITSPYNPEETERLKRFDFGIRGGRGMRSGCLFRQEARDAIAPVLGDQVSWHEAIVDGERWHRMYVRQELNLLDAEHSWMVSSPLGNNWPMHDYAAFKPEAVEASLFVVQGWGASSVFMGEELAMKIRALQIRGLQVKEAWTLGQSFQYMQERSRALRQQHTSADTDWTEQTDSLLPGSALTLSGQGADLLGIDVDEAPQALVEAIDAHLETLHESGGELTEVDNLVLGFLYCEQFRRAANWEWTTICHASNDHGFTPAVVAPDRSHAVLAKFVVGAALEELVDEGVPVTLIGSFVLATSGKLQPQPAKAYVLLW